MVNKEIDMKLLSESEPESSIEGTINRNHRDIDSGMSNRTKYRYNSHIGLMVMTIPVSTRRNIFANYKIDRNKVFV